MAVSRRTVNANGATRREMVRPAWSPAQAVAIIAGLLFVVLGGVGLARGGTNFSHLLFTHSRVAGLSMSALSSLVELIVGVIVLAGGAYPSTAKGTMSFFGVLMLAFGLVVAIDARPFFRSWGYDQADGIFYIIVGVVLLATAIASPIFLSKRDVVVQESVRSDVLTQ